QAPFGGSSPEHFLFLHTQQTPPSPRRFNPRLPRDLETIALTCLEKEPSRRYPDCQALAEELARCVQGRTILSRPIGVAGRLWRWSRRNPLLAGTTTLAALALLVTAVLSLAFAVNERRHGENLRVALRDARYQLAENYLDRALTPPQTEPD